MLPRLTARDNVMLPMLYAGVPHEVMAQRAEAALRAVGLGQRGDHKPVEMSGGQQQRAAIARALVNGPSILLADEPTGNLDSRTSVEVMAIFQELNVHGITIVLVTHEPDIAEFCSRVVRFRDGRVVEDRHVERPKRASQVLAEMPLAEEPLEANRMSALAVEPRPTVHESPNDDYAILTRPLPGSTTGAIALGQSVGSALTAIRANKMRAFLTMLGIIIGVAAVIVMIALGQGASQSVQARLAGLGTNLLTVSPGSFGGPGGVQGGAGSRQSLTEADAQAIQRQVPGIAALNAEISAGNTQVQAGNQNWSTQVRAVYPAYFAINSWTIGQGGFFDQADLDSGALVAVIGQTVASNLFGTTNPIGQTITVRNVPMKVKGVLAAKGSNGFQDQDDVVLIPFTTGQVRLFRQTYVQNITVQVADAEQIPTVQTAITDLLRTRHRLTGTAANDFTVRNNNYPARSASKLDPIEALRYD